VQAEAEAENHGALVETVMVPDSGFGAGEYGNDSRYRLFRPRQRGVATTRIVTRRETMRGVRIVPPSEATKTTTTKTMNQILTQMISSNIIALRHRPSTRIALHTN